MGTAAAPITFTTATTTTVTPGRWYFIAFRGGSSGRLERCVVNSAGRGGSAALSIASSDVVVQDCRIHHNARTGVYVGGAAPTLTGSAIYFNGGPGLVTSNSQPILRGNLFYRNTGFGIRNDTPARVVNARYQAWGHPSGPYHPARNSAGLGDRVSDGVEFDPWLRVAGLTIPGHQPPQALVVEPAADGFTFTDLPLRFRIRITDTDTLTPTGLLNSQVFLRAEIFRAGTPVAVYDQVENPVGWDQAAYRLTTTDGVTATLTLTRALPAGDYALRVAAFDGLGMATAPVRNFRVNLPSWGIASVQPDQILATPNVTHTLTLYGAGFTGTAEVLLETRFISDTVVQTVQERPAAVRVRSPEAIELDVNMTYPGPWDVVVRQNGEERRSRFWALPYFPLMRLSYERSPVFTPGRNWEHTLTLSNEGTASGVAIVALRPPTGTLLITTTLNSELLGHLDSPLGKVYFVATQVDPGATKQVKLVYNLPWSAVGVPNGLQLGDALDFAYYGVGQPLAELWNDIKDLARAGNESDAEGYLDDLVTLSMWSTGRHQGWALQAFRELPDEDMAYSYLEAVARRYPWVADALMSEYLTDIRISFEEELAQQKLPSQLRIAGASQRATQSESGLGYKMKQWLHDVVGPDPWYVLKGTFSWQSVASGESAVFLVATAEGMLSNLTFGLWRPKLGSEWLAKNLCLNPALVRAGRLTGEGIAFLSTLPLPTKGGAATSVFGIAGRNTFLKLAETTPKPPEIKLGAISRKGNKYVFKLAKTRGDKDLGDKSVEPTRWGYDFVMETFTRVDGDDVLLTPRSGWNLYHAGVTRKGEFHHGFFWQAKYGIEGDTIIVYAGPHIYENRLFIPWQGHAKGGYEIPLKDVRILYGLGSTVFRRGSLETTKLAPIELEQGPEPGSSCQTLRGAYDPNEIVGLPASPFIRPNQDLDLTIHFENLRTATDPAETVEITMTVPAALDTATIQLVGSSHPVVATLDTDQRVLRFTFAGINLPPNRTPPEGEGWVRLRVQPRPDLASGTQFSLQADIVFWAFGAPNPPIRTNVLTYTVDATAPEVRLQGARVEGSQVVLDVQASDGHSGMRTLRVLYTADERQWFLGDGRLYDPARNTASETIRFTPQRGGSIKVVIMGFDAMGYAVETDPISLTVQTGIYLPVVSK